MSLFINNKWVRGEGEQFSSIDPGNRQIVWKGTAAASRDIEKAILAAKEAFKLWSSQSLEKRISYVKEYQKILKDKTDLLAESIAKSMGKPLWDAKGEVASMIAKIDISIEAQSSRCQEILKEGKTVFSHIRYKPHGVIAVFGPFNFPGHLPNGHIIPALIAGNTILFKPSEYTPLVAEEMIKCWESVHIPAGVINLLQGGKETGQAIAHHLDIDGLFFTGSYPTGKWLSSFFGNHPEKILALEMGGNNPLIVWEPDLQDLKKILLLIVQSAYLTSGQRCTCARRLIVQNNEEGEKILQALIPAVRSISIGHYSKYPEPFMGPVVNVHTASALINKQEDLENQGGKALVRMQLLENNTGLISPGLMDITEAKGKDEEIFGPFLQIIRVNTFAEALSIANNTKFGLAAGIICKNRELYNRFYSSIKAGIINWNTPTTGASSHAPFGGVGCSGNNRPSAYYAADYCNYPIASMEKDELDFPENLPPGLSL